MQFRAQPIDKTATGFEFDTVEEFRSLANPRSDYEIEYLGDNPVRRDLFARLSGHDGDERLVEFLQNRRDEDCVLILYHLEHQNLDPRCALVEDVDGSVVIDGRFVDEDYGADVASESGLLRYFVWFALGELFVNYRGPVQWENLMENIDQDALAEDLICQEELVIYEKGGAFFLLNPSE